VLLQEDNEGRMIDIRIMAYRSEALILSGVEI